MPSFTLPSIRKATLLRRDYWIVALVLLWDLLDESGVAGNIQQSSGASLCYLDLIFQFLGLV